jgi:hypothetical protein
MPGAAERRQKAIRREQHAYFIHFLQAIDRKNALSGEDHGYRNQPCHLPSTHHVQVLRFYHIRKNAVSQDFFSAPTGNTITPYTCKAVLLREDKDRPGTRCATDPRSGPGGIRPVEYAILAGIMKYKQETDHADYCR